MHIPSVVVQVFLLIWFEGYYIKIYYRGLIFWVGVIVKKWDADKVTVLGTAVNVPAFR